MTLNIEINLYIHGRISMKLLFKFLYSFNHFKKIEQYIHVHFHVFLYTEEIKKPKTKFN